MCSSGSWDSSEEYKTFEGWDEKTRGMGKKTFEGWDEKTRSVGKSKFNLVQDIRCLLHIPHILRSVQVEHGTPMENIGWDENTRGMGKSEFNLVQDIRCLLHIPHILRSVQVDHGTPMKHIKYSRHEMRKLAAWEKASSTSCRTFGSSCIFHIF
ncbi:hypothetical protein B0H13DRAFT_2285957 [Mycena leptocephala]|nr:hypothetical protein B0H13DRAFT_2285957 [Mycena leptocephala]